MGFSPEMDLVAGTVVAAIGVDTLRRTRSTPRLLPIASLPLLFGLHQLVETVVWWPSAPSPPAGRRCWPG